MSFARDDFYLERRADILGIALDCTGACEHPTMPYIHVHICIEHSMANRAGGAVRAYQRVLSNVHENTCDEITNRVRARREK